MIDVQSPGVVTQGLTGLSLAAMLLTSIQNIVAWQISSMLGFCMYSYADALCPEVSVAHAGDRFFRASAGGQYCQKFEGRAKAGQN